MVPILAEILIRSNSEVRLETWVVTAVVYFAAIGLASSSRAISELSLWFTGMGALAYGTIALAVQFDTIKISDDDKQTIAKMLSSLPVLEQGARISGILILAFTFAYGVERFKRHVINGEEF